MLKDFLYLDRLALAQYSSQVEDGLRGNRSITSRSATGSSTAAHTDILSESEGQSAAEEKATSFFDTPEAQFERLIAGVRGNEEEFGWVDVSSPDAELSALRVGSFISVRSDLYIPPISKALASADQLRGLAGTMKAMSSFQSATNAPPTDLPDMAQVDALVAFADAAAGSETVIGEFDNTDWKVFGQLQGRASREDFEGESFIVGKIQSVLSAGSWKPLLTMPGMDLMSRSDRREMERKGPDAGQEENWIHGPGLMINVLAIYR